MASEIVAHKLRTTVQRFFSSPEFAQGPAVQSVEDEAALRDLLVRQAPRVLILDCALGDDAFQRIKAVLSDATCVAWVSPRQAPKRAVNRSQQLKNSILVEGGPRFLVRFSEAVFLQAGVLRERKFDKASGRLQFDGAEFSARIERSTARQMALWVGRTDVPWTEDSVGTLSFRWRGAQTLLSVRLAHLEADLPLQGHRVTVFFEKLTPETGNTIHSLLSAGDDEPSNHVTGAVLKVAAVKPQETLRAAKRVRPLRKLGLKVRLELPSGAGRTYGRVVDISERGFAASVEDGRPYGSGDRLEALIFWKGRSVRASIEITRAEASGKARAYGARFVAMQPDEAQKLLELIDLSSDVGLKGSASSELVERV